MANNNSGRKGSYVNAQGKVVLSKSREGYLARIKDAKVRADVRKGLEAEVMDKHEARQKYLAERNTFSVVQMESGLGRWTGTGAKWCHFSKAGVTEFLEFMNSKEGKEFLKNMPETPVAAAGGGESDE